MQKGSLASPGFISSVFMAFVNCRFVLAAVRRQVLTMWLAALTDAAVKAGHSLRSSADVIDLFDGASDSDKDVGIACLVPNTRQLAHIVHVVYSKMVLPTLGDHERLSQHTSGYKSSHGHYLTSQMHACLTTSRYALNHVCHRVRCVCRQILRYDTTTKSQSKVRTFIEELGRRCKLSACLLTLTGG